MSRYIFPLLLILSALGIFLAGIKPMLAKIDSQKIEERTAKLALENTTNLFEIQEALLEKYKVITPEDRVRLLKLVPDQVDNVRFIIDIDAVAGKFGMKIGNLQLAGDPAATDSSVIGPDGKTYGTITLQFDITGSYGAVRAFLADLDSSLRLVDVDTVEFLAGDADKNKYTIKVRTYWLKS